MSNEDFGIFKEPINIDGLQIQINEEGKLDFDAIKDDFLDLFKGIAADHNLNKDKMENLGKHTAKIIKWRMTAKDETERAQADEAYEIMVNEIPITIKGMVSEETIMKAVANAIIFGLRIAKLIITTM